MLNVEGLNIDDKNNRNREELIVIVLIKITTKKIMIQVVSKKEFHQDHHIRLHPHHQDDKGHDLYHLLVLHRILRVLSLDLFIYVCLFIYSL